MLLIRSVQVELNTMGAVIKALPHLARPSDRTAKEVLSFVCIMLFNANEQIQVHTYDHQASPSTRSTASGVFSGRGGHWAMPPSHPFSWTQKNWTIMAHLKQNLKKMRRTQHPAQTPHRWAGGPPPLPKAPRTSRFRCTPSPPLSQNAKYATGLWIAKCPPILWTLGCHLKSDL